MMFPRFFYEDGAGNGGGAGDDAANKDINKDADLNKNADDNKGAGDDTASKDKGPELPKSIFTPEELKDLGVESEADAKKLLLELRKQEKERNVPDAEKVKQQNLEKADFLKHAAKDNLFSLDEYTQMESLKSTPDRDLVFGEYLKSFKEEHPDLSGEALTQAAKEEFESDYKLDSTNEKTKARGEAKLKREAADLRGPLTKKYEDAYGSFSQEKDIAAKIPAFNKFIEDVIKEATPEKLVVKTKEGEQDIDIETPLTKEQKEEIEKMFHNPKTFSDYIADGVKAEDLKVKIAKKIDGFIKANNFEAAVTNGYVKGKGVGTAQGSNAGADNLFGAKDKQKQPAKVVTIDESNKKVAEARERYQQGR